MRRSGSKDLRRALGLALAFMAATKICSGLRVDDGYSGSWQPFLRVEDVDDGTHALWAPGI